MKTAPNVIKFAPKNKEITPLMQNCLNNIFYYIIVLYTYWGSFALFITQHYYIQIQISHIENVYVGQKDSLNNPKLTYYYIYSIYYIGAVLKVRVLKLPR